MQRNTLLLTVSCMFGGLGCLAEGIGRPSSTDYWTTIGGATEDDAGGTETGLADSADSGSESESESGSDTDSDSGDGDDGDDGEGDPSEGGDGDGDPGNDPDAEEDPEACASVSEAADLAVVPADIIFIVDNSGSMDEETLFVQTQMNGFSAQIEMSGIDHHVVLISAYPGQPGNDNGICIEAPLGGGSCPEDDNNLPVYRHVDQKVGSHNALAKLISTELAWKNSIRPDSMKHIVVVSDDESELDANSFKNQFAALDPSYESYVFHAIVCPWDCPESAGVGETYIDLVDQTGGVLGDLCAQDFQVVFDALADAVIQGIPLSCQFDIPPPPMGMNLDPDKVNVELDDGNGSLDEVPRVMDLADCMNHPDGWYYDDPVNPVQIFLCPQTCTKAQGYEMGTINVLFGCDTYVPTE
jgi:hypothetical protein